MKVCNGCSEEQPLTEYYSRNGKPIARCKTCTKKQTSTARTTRRETGWKRGPDRPEAKRRRKLMARYNMTIEQYDKMFDEQQGLCAICKEPERKTTATGAVMRLQVDHDHACCPGDKSCGQCVRRLLCWRCNTTIGRVNDNPALLQAMIDYLKEHGAKDNTEITF